MKRQPDDFPAYVHRQTHGDYKRDEKCEEPRLEGWETSSTVALILTLILFVVLAYIYALIKPQWCDEVWQMIPAANLAFNGYLGMGDQTTLILPTLNSETHMYWYPPLSHVSLAIWFKVWDGYNLMLARWHTIAWGVVLLCGVYWMGAGWRLARFMGCRPVDDLKWVGVWAALICALDYNVLYSSDARPDLMCAALGIWAIATRSAWFAAAACMVHPFGIMYPIALACIKRKVEWLPYLVVAGAWGIYIMQDPTLWWETIVNQYIVHVVQIAYTPGLAVYMGFGEVIWRAVSCSASLHARRWFLFGDILPRETIVIPL